MSAWSVRMADLRKRGERVLDLLRQGDLDKAGAEVFSALQEAKESGNTDAIATFTRYAALVRERGGDIAGSLRAYEEGIAACGEDPLLLYGAGTALEWLGDQDRARSYFNRCHRAALARKDDAMLQLLRDAGIVEPDN